MSTVAERCKVESCNIVAVESGYCFYHDRCPPAEITVKEAAKVLHDTRYKKKERTRQITETVTEWEPEQNVTATEVAKTIAALEEPKQLPPAPEVDLVSSLDTSCDLLGNDKYLTGILNLQLASGAGRISIYTDANLFDLSLEDRAFLWEMVDMMRAYHRKHPTIAKQVLK